MVASNVGFVQVGQKSNVSTYERPLWLTVRASAEHLGRFEKPLRAPASQI